MARATPRTTASAAEPVYRVVSPLGENTAKMAAMAPRLETLDGKTVLEIPASAIPDQFKLSNPATKKNANGAPGLHPEAGKTFLRMTAMDVAPNGDLYVTDGYASDYVHRFDRNGKYLKSLLHCAPYLAMEKLVNFARPAPSFATQPTIGMVSIACDPAPLLSEKMVSPRSPATALVSPMLWKK